MALHESPDVIDLVDMASKLRQLLFDKHSLADAINDGRKLEFRVGTFPPHMQPGNDPFWEYVEYQALADGLDPATALSDREVLVLTRGQFGQHVIAFSGGQTITVKDVVKYNANALGGSHFDPTPKPDFAKLAKLKALSIGGYPAASRDLRAITRVALKGLTPLIQLAQSRGA
jgi:hypothetical protein